ncbi:hypothetical protein [Sinorhizobium chiapasense]
MGDHVRTRVSVGGPDLVIKLPIRRYELNSRSGNRPMS